jgi:hypothetical protein
VILRSGQRLDVAEPVAVVAQLLEQLERGRWVRLRTAGGSLIVRRSRIDAVLPA